MRGSVDYIAPEILAYSEHDHKIDTWALGVLIFEMIVGIPPFNDTTVNKIFENIENRQILEWEHLQNILDPLAVSIVNDLLQLDPKKRPELE